MTELNYKTMNERFKMPTSKQLIDIAITFNNNELNEDELSKMLAMSQFVLDRLHKHGTIEVNESDTNN